MRDIARFPQARRRCAGPHEAPGLAHKLDMLKPAQGYKDFLYLLRQPPRDPPKPSLGGGNWSNPYSARRGPSRRGKPETMKTDQGFIDLIKTQVDTDIQIGEDSKGTRRDNVFVERLWRTKKFEQAYLRAYDSVPDDRESLHRQLMFNTIHEDRVTRWTDKHPIRHISNRRSQSQREIHLQRF